MNEDFLNSLLVGLPAGERADVLRRILLAQEIQLEDRRNPRRRRRRNSDGVLEMPQPLATQG